MFHRNNKIILIVASDQRQDRQVTDIKIFDLKFKKWKNINLWHYNKSFPNEILISPVNEKIDFITINYLLEEPVFLLFDYESGLLKRLNIVQTELVPVKEDRK